MNKLYFDKITGEVINTKTDKVWCLEDVPTLWKASVEELLLVEQSTLR
jgi:hypothetical protein